MTILARVGVNRVGVNRVGAVRVSAVRVSAVRVSAALLVVGGGVVVGGVAGRLRRVGVSGPSMLPTLADGDALLAYPAHRVRAGDVVIARFRSRPDLLVVKRAVRPVAGAWWVQGDNPRVADDSRRYGPAVVLGVVWCRYWPTISRTGLRATSGRDASSGSG